MDTALKNVFELDVQPTGERSVVKMQICGMEWEAEATLYESTLEITLWNNREVEGNVWLCEAHVALALPYTETSVGTSVFMHGEHIREAFVKFRACNRKHLFVIPRSEIPSNQLKFEISVDIRNLVGYRWKSMFTTNFFKPSTLSDLCIMFHNTSIRLYVNSQYLCVHSPYFAQRLAKTTIRQNNSSLADHSSEVDDISDYDVMSLKSDMTAGAKTIEPQKFHCPDDIPLNGNVESTTVGTGDGIIILDDVELQDFLVLLDAIYPPGITITKETLPPLISTSYLFGVDHILWRCEDYLLSDKGLSEFDLITRLEYASSYKMATLQADCLRRLPSAQSVREVLEDPRMENSIGDVRSLLLETLLRRLKTDSVGSKDSRSVEETAKLVKEADVPKVEEPVPSISPLLPDDDLCTAQEEPGVPVHIAPPVPPRRVRTGKQHVRKTEESPTALRDRLKKEMALRKNLELTLKCTREFIRQTNAAQNSDVETAILPVTEAGRMPPQTIPIMQEVPSVPPHAAPLLNNSFVKKLVFDTFDASKLDKLKRIAVQDGNGEHMYSMHEVFSDIMLEPFATMECVTYSFVCHFYIKLYQERIIPLLTAHCPPKFDAFPQILVEGIASTIIIGFDFHDQLNNDAFMIHELKVTIEKQLRADFEVLRSNVKAVTESC